jgi:hypothetical protein
VGGEGGAGGDGRNFNCNRGGVDAKLVAQFAVDAGEDILILLEVAAHILATLADALTLEAVPGTTLVDDAVYDSEIESVSLAGDSFAVEDVELGVAEGSEPTTTSPSLTAPMRRMSMRMEE